MSDRIAIHPTGPLHATIRPPGSKSITNRALVCAALADGTSTLNGALDSEDTRVMIDSLMQLGVAIELDALKSRLTVTGCRGVIPVADATLFVANSGTTMRFLTALSTLGNGRYRLDGVERMRERPVGDLVSTLNRLGAFVKCEGRENCPPLYVRGQGLKGGNAMIRGDISSQFLSGILMVAPYAKSDVVLIVNGPLVSQPYVRMTLGVMSAFGVSLDSRDLRRFTIQAGQKYQACEYDIEPDASAASYFWAAAAITGGQVTVDGLNHDSLQGDVAFCECLERMGCRIEYSKDSITAVGGTMRGIDMDMNAISDTVQSLAAVALFADGPTTITGVAHIRHKETDRIGDLARELRKLGAKVDELPDGLRIIPGEMRGAEIDTYNDHRMAMSLALVGLRVPGVVINNPQCTEKTYPRFFDDLTAISRHTRN